MRRRYVLTGFALVTVTALVGTAVAGIGGGTGDGPGAKAAAKKKGQRGPRGPAGPRGAQGPPGPQGAPGTSASNAAGFAASNTPVPNIGGGGSFTPLVTLTNVPASSTLLATATVQFDVSAAGTARAECRIEIDGIQAGLIVTQEIAASDPFEPITVTAGRSVSPGTHPVVVACQKSAGTGALNFQLGNLTTSGF